jgi:hypothetical protein
MSGPGSDPQVSAERGQPVGHALQPGAVACRARIETGPVVGDGEFQGAFAGSQADGRPRGRRVLRDVLQRFQDAEVRGGFGVRRVAPDPVRLHRHRDRRLLSLSVQRGRQAPVRQQRRVYPASEITEVLQRVLGI